MQKKKGERMKEKLLFDLTKIIASISAKMFSWAGSGIDAGDDFHMKMFFQTPHINWHIYSATFAKNYMLGKIFARSRTNDISSLFYAKGEMHQHRDISLNSEHSPR